MQHTMPSTHENDKGIMLICLILVIFLCWLFFDIFVYMTCWILYWIWQLVDIFPRFHPWIAERINMLAYASKEAKNIDFFQWVTLMNLTSGVLLIFFVPVGVLSGSLLFRHPALGFRSKRAINPDSLPGITSKFSPTVIPVLKYGNKGLMNNTDQENAWALRPEEFAKQHNLIQRKTLDTEATTKAFENQLGDEMKPLSEWLPYERALFVIFGLQYFLDERKTAASLLDNLNRSCLVSGLRFWKRSTVSDPLFSLSDKGYKRLLQLEAVSDWMSSHRYVRSALTALYANDLRLSPSRFRWLKGIDRTLWYALHTAGTAKVFVEGAGVVAQARAERAAVKLGLKVRGNMVYSAVRGLAYDLENIGLIYPETVTEPVIKQKMKSSIFRAIYSPEIQECNEE